MSSRREQKDAAQARRAEAEAATRAAASRRQRIRLVLGGASLVGLLSVVGVVVALTAGGDDQAGGETAASGPAIPAVRKADLQAAAKLAGAAFTSYDYDYGSGAHTIEPVKYPRNPPTNGPHHPQWASDANYAGRTTPPTEQLVHSLEHGRVEIQYAAGLPQAQIDQLVALYDEDPYHVLLFENATGMKAQVAVTAWSHGMTMDRFSEATFDAIRAFKDKYRDQAPERVA